MKPYLYDIDMYYALAEYFDVPITYMVGVSDNREWSLMSDAETAETAEQEEKESQEHLMKLYRDLSTDMQDVVKNVVATLWKQDRDHGRLRSQEEE